MKKWVHSCPHCGSKMAIALKGGKTQLLCPLCDADPLKSPKIYRLINAAQPLKDSRNKP